MAVLEQIVLSSFMTEVSALKPGNVSVYTDGHDMVADDFKHSAELTTPILCDANLSVGERILNSVKLTKIQVGSNTNLGMLLLFAPLIKAAQISDNNMGNLQKNLSNVLVSLDKTETAHVFEAIRVANPGGLGDSDKFDVRSKAESGLLDAMAEAQQRDLIAQQYTTDFIDIFSLGLEIIKDFNMRWNSVKWATVACYLTFLARYQDSHIRRKFGEQAAEKQRIKAIPIAEQFKNNDNPENAVNALLEYDKELKDSNINPGTSADMTAASVLVFNLINNN